MDDNQYVVEVNAAAFQPEVIARSRRPSVIGDCWAPWFAPCRMLSPGLERVTRDGNGALGLAKVNVDNNPNLAARYGVQGIPAVKVFKDGRVAGEFAGARSERDVREFVKRYAPSAADNQLTAAQALEAEGRLDQAEQLYRDILAASPGHAQAALQLSKLLLAQGRGEEADQALHAVPDESRESVTAEALLPLAHFLMASPNGSSEAVDKLHQAAAQQAREHQYAAAMDSLLDLLRKNRAYHGGEAKQVMLALFELLGDDPLVAEYRRKLASVLF